MSNFNYKKFNQKCSKFLEYKMVEAPYTGAVTTQYGCWNIDFLLEAMVGESWYVYPKFDSDLNWLFEVINKIESLNFTDVEGINCFSVKINGNSCEVLLNSQVGMAYEEISESFHDYINVFTDNKKIDAIIKSIDQFIEWYYYVIDLDNIIKNGNEANI